MPDFTSECALYLDQKKSHFAKIALFKKVEKKCFFQIFWWFFQIFWHLPHKWNFQACLLGACTHPKPFFREFLNFAQITIYPVKNIFMIWKFSFRSQPYLDHKGLDTTLFSSWVCSIAFLYWDKICALLKFFWSTKKVQKITEKKWEKKLVKMLPWLIVPRGF